MKKTLLRASIAAVVVFAAVTLADVLGLLPSLSRTFAACKADTAKQLVGLRRYGDRPVDDPRNVEWFGKHAELFKACMEVHGYKLDEKEANALVDRMMK